MNIDSIEYNEKMFDIELNINYLKKKRANKIENVRKMGKLFPDLEKKWLHDIEICSMSISRFKDRQKKLTKQFV